MKGLLLLNLGTPDSPSPKDVRRYLRQFLMDPFVIDIPYFQRWLVVQLIIAPLRCYRSSRAYQKIWSREGSPLLVNSLHLKNKVEKLMDNNWSVSLGMRYGNPSIKSAIDDLINKGVDEIIAIPLYPQYATSSTESCIFEVRKVLSKKKSIPVKFAKPFYDDDGFINASAEKAKSYFNKSKPEFVLMSFHGLPERHLTKGDATTSHCLKKQNCCDNPFEGLKCYRQHCQTTARLIAEKLGISQNQYQISFQSRLGRTKWIEPYTDYVLKELAEKGIKNLAVMCPSFVADCLETLEEIGIVGRKNFLDNGGESFTLIPCLNADNSWAEAVKKMALTI